MDGVGGQMGNTMDDDAGNHCGDCVGVSVDTAHGMTDADLELRLEEMTQDYRRECRRLTLWDMVQGRRTEHMSVQEFSESLPERQLPSIYRTPKCENR